MSAAATLTLMWHVSPQDHVLRSTWFGFFEALFGQSPDGVAREAAGVRVLPILVLTVKGARYGIAEISGDRPPELRSLGGMELFQTEADAWQSIADSYRSKFEARRRDAESMGRLLRAAEENARKSAKVEP